MTLKRIIIAVMTMAMVAVSAQAKGHKSSRYHGGKRYASIMKQEQPASKFSTFSDHDETYPSDALYSSIWVTDRLNPYQAKLPETFRIVVTGFEAPIEGHVSSEYGPRWGRLHEGIDIALRKGDTVRAAFDGQVRIGRKFNKGGYGWYVVIRHDNGLETLYGHLTRSLVNANQIVKAGQPIGLGGNTGRSTGPHLHFETRFLGYPMNPRNIIDFDNNVIFSDTYIIDRKKSFKEYNRYHKIYYGKSHKHGKKHHEMAIAKQSASDSLSTNEEVAEENDEEGAQAEAKAKAMANTRRTICHTVKQGDNLSVIARKYHTSVTRICELNHIKNRDGILSLGKRLIIEAR